MLTKFEGPCFSNKTCMPWYPSREVRNWNFKMLHYSARSCIASWQLAMGLWNSKVNACHIIHDLRYSKMCLKWFLGASKLNTKPREQPFLPSSWHIEADSESYLAGIWNMGPSFWSGDRKTILDVPILNLPGRKIRLPPSVDKVMIIIFWDYEGIILVDVVPRR